MAQILIAGAGIIGLATARELVARGFKKIALIEKESDLGAHASGRNSGVVHAGIYYATDSLKAKFCIEGARRLREYCLANSLPFEATGKVIVAQREELVPSLEKLFDRAIQNGATAQKISLGQLKKLEPEARSHGFAIHSPLTAVIDSKAVLQNLRKELASNGVEISFNEQIQSLDPEKNTAQTTKQTRSFDLFFNCAGLQADKIAHSAGVGLEYSILPFKGIYRKVTDEFAARIHRAIYPSPDLNMPFLGVHFTRGVDGSVKIGPTAIPAFGRENYGLLSGLSLIESPQILLSLSKMFAKNHNHFREMVREETLRYSPENFLKAAQDLVPSITSKDISDKTSVGIRAQLYNRKTLSMELDYIIQRNKQTVHVLNAISPAFTSSFAFAEHIVTLALG